MDFNIAEMITNVAFPIVAYASLYYMLNNAIKGMQSSVDKLANEVTKLTTIMQNKGEQE